MKFFHKYALFESLKKAQEIAEKIGLDPNNPDLVWVSDMLGQQNAKYLPIFVKIIKQYDNSDDPEWHNRWLEQYINLVIKYRLNIQQSGVDINNFKDSEQLHDFLTKIEEQSSVKKLMNMVPKQVRNLINGHEEKFYNLFLMLDKLSTENNEITEVEMKEFLFNKISRNKTTEELYNHIKGFVDAIGGKFTVEGILEKVSKADDATVIYKDEHVVIAEIGNFETASELGKDTSWCISQDKTYFDQYVLETNKQFFIWDTSKGREDKLSMIGVTMTANGYITACHARNDNVIDPSYVDKWKKHFTSWLPMDDMKEFRFGWPQTIRVNVEELRDAGFKKKDMTSEFSVLFPKLKEAFLQIPEGLNRVLSFEGVISYNMEVHDCEEAGIHENRKNKEWKDSDNTNEYIIDALFEMYFKAQNIRVAAQFIYSIIKDSDIFMDGDMLFTIIDPNSDGDEEVNEENIYEYVPV